MDEQDLKFLSKHKHIYLVSDQIEYKNSEAPGKIYDWFVSNIHIQKYPVIYLNKHKVYFKMPGCEDLQHAAMSYVRKELDDATKEMVIDKIANASFFHLYFWELSDESIHFFKNLIGLGEDLRKENEIEQLVKRKDLMEAELKKINEKLEKLNG